MNDSFQNLYNQFAASGIQSYQPQLANLFETTANEFTQFLQNAIPPEEDQQGDEEEEDAEVQENAPQDLQSGEEQQPGLTVPSQGDEQFIWDTDPFPQLFHCSFPPLNCPLSPKAPYLTRSPSLPETYSYTETSFTRRLIRLTIEAGVKSLTNNPSVESTPRWLSFVYSFGGTHETVLSCLQALLSRSANQNFEDWTNTPILHLGGAGLHFPRKGIDASSPAPNWWSEYAPMGPLPVHIQPVDPKYLGWKIEDIVNDIGLGGDWFDANDVEWYLQSRGLNLDVTSTVVEINEDIPLQPEMMSRLSLAEETRGRENHERGGQEAGQGYARNQYFSPISMSPSQQPEANFEDSTSWSSSVFPPQPQVAALNGQLWNQNLSINVTTDTNTNMNMNMNMNQSSSAMTTTPGINRNGRRKTRKFFDVERFLKGTMRKLSRSIIYHSLIVISYHRQKW